MCGAYILVLTTAFPDQLSAVVVGPSSGAAYQHTYTVQTVK